MRYPLDPLLSSEGGAVELAYQRAFADVVGFPRRRVLLISPENEPTGWTSPADAIESRACFAVEVRPEIVAADFDDVPAERAMRLYAWARERGFGAVLCVSGNPERRHVFVRVEDPDLRRRTVAEAKRLGADVRGRIRPPLSPHRSGAVGWLLEPTTPLDALIALVEPIRVAGLSRRLTVVLRYGQEVGGYPSRSEGEQAIAFGAYQAGWDFATFVRLMLDPDHAGGARAQELERAGAHHGVDALARCWDKAEAHWTGHPAPLDGPPARDFIARAESAAHKFDFEQATDCLVLDAHLAIARCADSTGYGASVREVVLRTGLSVNTVTRAHQRLEDQQWIRSRPRGRLSVPGRFVLLPDNLKTLIPPTGGVCLSRNVAELPMGHDAFMPEGLRASGYLTLRALHRGAETVAAITRMSGQHRRTVVDALARLKAVGLATADDRGRWAPGERDLDEVAVELGTAGTVAQKRERYEEERARFRERLASPTAAPPPSKRAS